MLHFWLSVVIKTFWDSMDFIGQTKNGMVFAGLVLLLTALLLWMKHGWRDAVKHWYRTAGEGLLIAVVAWILVFCAHFVSEPFHLQDDMRARRDSVMQEMVGIGAVLTTCRADLQTESAKTFLLSDRVQSQQQIINSQQGTFNSQQKTFNAQQTTLSAQQATMNSCMTTIGELEKPESLKTLAFRLHPARKNTENSAAAYVEEFLLLSNKILTPVRLLATCDKAIVSAGGGILGTATTMGGGGGKVSENSYLSVLSSPALAPNAPMLIQVYSNDENLSACRFDLN